MGDKMQACIEQLENTKTQLNNAKIEVEKPFHHEDELKTKTARLAELNAMLNLDDKDNEIVDDSIDEEVEVPERKVIDRDAR